MIKIAVFCPRLPRESEGAWQLRVQACRLCLRPLHNIEALTFDTLEHLQSKHRKRPFRCILVAQSGCYPSPFWEWASQRHIDVLDVLRRPKPQAADKALLAAGAVETP